jgi:hypothetical protein
MKIKFSFADAFISPKQLAVFYFPEQSQQRLTGV